MRKRIWYILAFLVGCNSLWAQVQPDSSNLIGNDPDVDIMIEDAMTTLESDEETDWAYYTDFLNDLKSKPLNLNTASRDELIRLPGMTELLAGNLQAYIRDFGALSSVFELQAVPGFSRETFNMISPYVTVRESSEKDINRTQLHPKGPSVKEIINGWNHEFILRYIRTVEEQKGYTLTDVDANGDSIAKYAGSPDKVYARWRTRFGKNFSFSVVGEKDQGEKFGWDPDNRTYGFDFLSAHLAIRDFGAIKNVVIGDYNLQVGQGLALSTGLGFGKGGETVNAIKRPGLGVLPTSSVNENQYLRGTAATVAVKHFYFTGFFSKARRDGSVTIASVEDTTDAQIGNFNSLQTSGFHRTKSEIENKAQVGEMIYGGRAEYRRSRLKVAVMHYFQDFDPGRGQRTGNIRKFDFQGEQNYITSMDWDLTLNNLNFFGEVARSKSGGFGTVAGLLAALSPKVDMALHFRKLDRDFHSFKGYIFAERPIALQNETGFYSGIQVKFSPKWRFNGFFDQFWFPWHRFGAEYPSKGHEYLAQLEFKPSRGTTLYLRYRSDNKERNASEFPDGQQLEYLIPTQRNGLRLHFSRKISREITLRSRIEQSWWKRGNEERSKGFLVYQDVIWKFNWDWRLSARYAIFDSEDYDSRIYAFENEILGYFAIPAYSGKGTRYYLMLQYSPGRNVDFWVRWSQWQYRKRDVISSGNNEILGNTRSEIKLQMRVKF